MKNIIIVSILFLDSLLTVSTLAHADSAVQNNQTAKLVIYRPNDGSSMSYRLWVDDQYMGKLKLKQVLELQLSPGEHVIRSNDRNRSELSVTVNEQRTTYVRAEIDRKTRMSLKVDKSPGGVMAGL
jgi:hypothetical protein